MLSGSTYTILQFVVFLVLLYSYPDDDSKSHQNMLVIKNVIKHVLYMCICWFYCLINVYTVYSDGVPTRCAITITQHNERSVYTQHTQKKTEQDIIKKSVLFFV